MAHMYRLGLVTWRYQVRIPVGPDTWRRGCVYTRLQTVQRHGVYTAAHGTVHYKEPLKSFEIRVGHSPGFGLPSVAILPQCGESDVKQYSLTCFRNISLKPHVGFLSYHTHTSLKGCRCAFHRTHV